MAFNKLIEAMGLYDHWLDAQSAVPNEDHQWALHAVQSMIWREAGMYVPGRVKDHMLNTARLRESF